MTFANQRCEIAGFNRRLVLGQRYAPFNGRHTAPLRPQPTSSTGSNLRYFVDDPSRTLYQLRPRATFNGEITLPFWRRGSGVFGAGFPCRSRNTPPFSAVSASHGRLNRPFAFLGPRMTDVKELYTSGIAANLLNSLHGPLTIAGNTSSTMSIQAVRAVADESARRCFITTI